MIKLHSHAQDRLLERGASETEVIATVEEGECFPAKKGRYYQVKQVMPIIAEELDRFLVVSVYVFFIGGVKWR